MLQKTSRFIFVFMLLSYTTSSFALDRRNAMITADVFGVMTGALTSYAVYCVLKNRIEDQNNRINELLEAESENDDLDKLLVLLQKEEDGEGKESKSFGVKEVLTTLVVGLSTGLLTRVLAKKILKEYVGFTRYLPRGEKLTDDSCSICLDDMLVDDDAACIETPCGHYFHEVCIKDHFKARYNYTQMNEGDVFTEFGPLRVIVQRNIPQEPNCPICRQQCNEKDLNYIKPI